MDNIPVPEEWGGAGYSDGNNAINQWLVSANSTNPLTGEPYAKQYWSTYKEGDPLEEQECLTDEYPNGCKPAN